MIIEMTTDMLLVRGIITQDDIWENLAEEGLEKEDFQPGYDQMTAWLLVIDEEDEDVAGVILMHTDTGIAVKMHPYLRKKYRRKGRDMMYSFYRWLLDNTDMNKVHKINVSIPKTDTKLINFAKKVGFMREGVNRESTIRQGEITDIQNMGITRDEIGAQVDGRSS